MISGPLVEKNWDVYIYIGTRIEHRVPGVKLTRAVIRASRFLLPLRRTLPGFRPQKVLPWVSVRIYLYLLLLQNGIDWTSWSVSMNYTFYCSILCRYIILRDARSLIQFLNFTQLIHLKATPVTVKQSGYRPCLSTCASNYLSLPPCSPFQFIRPFSDWE